MYWSNSVSRAVLVLLMYSSNCWSSSSRVQLSGTLPLAAARPPRLPLPPLPMRPPRPLPLRDFFLVYEKGMAKGCKTN